MRQLFPLTLVLLLLVACGAEPTPTPDLVATQVAVEKAAAATLTAEAPTVTNAPEPTSTPTATATDTPTATPTATNTPTNTPEPTNTSTPTRTPRPTNTPRPTATPTPRVGQRSNPVPFGESLDLVMNDEMEFTLSLTKVHRGEQAWNKIKKANRYNDPPPEGMEYLLVRAMVDYTEGPSDEALRLNQWDFRIISQGQIIEPEAIVDPEPEFDIEFFPGASGDGWMTWPIVEGDEEPLLVIGMDYDGSGGFFFEAWPDEPLPTNTPKPTAKPKATKAPTPVPKLAGIGEEVKAGNWLFKVTEVQYHKALYLGDNAKVAMGVYCVIFLDIQNQASGTTHFGELWWELHGAGGNKYTDDSATIRAAWQFGGKDTPWDDLNPGQGAQIVIAFDVAEGAKELQLYSSKLKKPFVLIGDAQPPQDQG
jgi:hypothetical protein